MLGDLCRNLTCLNPRCILCSQNPNKRCPDGVNFNSKYLEKNALKSKCGANIRLEVVNAATAIPAQQQRLEDVCLEVGVLQACCCFYGSQQHHQPQHIRLSGPLADASHCVVPLQLSVLDGKKFASLHETGEDIASCELFLTPKVSQPGRCETCALSDRDLAGFILPVFSYMLEWVSAQS